MWLPTLAAGHCSEVRGQNEREYGVFTHGENQNPQHVKYEEVNRCPI